MSNVIETIRSTGSDYWAAYVGGEKIKKDGLNDTPEPMSPLMTYLKFMGRETNVPLHKRS